MYGLHPRKGVIAIGSDADLVVWDAEKPVTITNGDLHHAVDYTPYEGVTVPAWPEIVIAGGDIVAENGELRAAPGRGRFLPCDRPAPARPLGSAPKSGLFRAVEV
jgi:dihydropyrimidinase